MLENKLLYCIKNYIDNEFMKIYVSPVSPVATESVNFLSQVIN